MEGTNTHRIKGKNEYLDKHFVKKICRYLYFFGLGNCFYEPIEKPAISRRIYIFITTFTHLYACSTVLCEALGYFRNDLTVREKNDLLLYAIAHPTVYMKYIILEVQKKKVRKFFKKIIEDMRVPSITHLDKEAIKKSKIYIIVLSGTMEFCVIFTIANAFVLHLKEGIPIRTLVTVWPKTADESLVADIARYLIQFFWFYFVTIMCLIDSLCLTGIVLLGYRFRQLQVYFEQLRPNILKYTSDKPRKVVEEEFKAAFLTGIKMHSETLWCARNLQTTIGFIYSTQVVQSILLIAISLIKLVRFQRSLPILLESFFFLLCMVVITGCYMMSCGDITNEASLLSTSIYNSGWELCSTKRKLRPLVVLAIQNSTRPVIMTAFGVYGLSYNNFISVIRLSYSFFAVMY